jgi:hypothetical protein
MFTDTEFDIWRRNFGLFDGALALIQRIRHSQPTRVGNGSRGNVVGRYPSRKMGVTIQFDSHKNELAFIHEYDNEGEVPEEEVLEFYDQPPAIKLEYEAVNGRHLGVLHTPDFFVIRARAAGWEECKIEEQLFELASKSPNRYVRDEDGNWHCPPANAYAEKFGFYYRIRSSKEINWTVQRNIEFLDDFYRSNPSPVSTDILTTLLTYTTEGLGITLDELFKRTDGTVSRDVIFRLIASNELYINLKDAVLNEPSKVRVFSNHEAAITYANLIHISAQDCLHTPSTVNLAAGSVIQWNGNGWRVVNIGDGMLGLVGEDKSFVEVPIAAFEKLVQQGRITSINTEAPSNLHPEAQRRIAQATKDDYKEANRKVEIVRAFISNATLSANVNIPDRTLRYWTAKYYEAQELYGNGYYGLLPCQRSGNTKNKLPVQTNELIDEFIENDYETHKQKGKSAVYAAYRLTCERRGIIPASYKTFCKTVNQRPRYKQTLKRQGHKAAYADKEFYWELTPTTPRHGECPLHIAHIDHTELDVELACSTTGQNFGRAWATFLTDAFSRRLAVYVTYDPPSYRSCMMIMRECVRTFGRLPQVVVVDGGREFSSTYFETLLARYECTKKTRPPAEGHFGSVSEKLFDTANTQFIHNLQGNTQIMRNVRQVTKSVNPKNTALWTLERLHLFLRQWAYEVYDTIEHPALGQTPRDTFTRGIFTTGERTHRLIPYDNEFRLLTLPTTPKTTAKVIVSRGVKINNIYYWTDTFRHPEIEGSRVSVRYDPFNLGLAFAYVCGTWSECHSQYYSTFRGRSEREITMATEELRRRSTRHSRQFNLTATRLAHFLESVESEEFVLKQRVADQEARNVIRLINNEALTEELEQNTHNTSHPSDLKPENHLQQELANLANKVRTATNLKLYEEF